MILFFTFLVFPYIVFYYVIRYCLLTCAKKPRFEPFFGFSRGFLEFFYYLIGSFDGRPAFLGNFFSGWLDFSDDYEGSFHVGVCQLEFFGFFQLPPRILMAVLASVSSSWILPDLYGMK